MKAIKVLMMLIFLNVFNNVFSQNETNDSTKVIFPHAFTLTTNVSLGYGYGIQTQYFIGEQKKHSIGFNFQYTTWGDSYTSKYDRHWYRNKKGSLYSGICLGSYFDEELEIYMSAQINIIGYQTVLVGNVGYMAELGIGAEGVFKTGIQIRL